MVDPSCSSTFAGPSPRIRGRGGEVVASYWRPRHASLRGWRPQLGKRGSRTIRAVNSRSSTSLSASRPTRSPRARHRSPLQWRTGTLDAGRGRPDHPRGGEGQVVSQDAARSARRPLPALVPQRVRRDRLDNSRLRGRARAHESPPRRPGASRGLDRGPPRGDRHLGDEARAYPREGHLRDPNLLGLGRGGGHVPFSPASKIRRPRAPRKTAPLLPAHVDELLLGCARTARDRLAVLVLLDCGVRRAELAGIRIRDFDLARSEEHTSELQSRGHLVCRLLLEKNKTLQVIAFIGDLFNYVHMAKLVN